MIARPGHAWKRHEATSLVTGETFEIFEPVKTFAVGASANPFAAGDFTDEEVHRAALRRTVYPMRGMRDATTL